MKGRCYHCDQPLFDDSACTLPGEHQHLSFCCPACRLVYQHINDSGLSEYYQRRSGNARQALQNHPDFSGYDDPQFQSQYFSPDGSGEGCSAKFLIENMHCSACAWLIEKRLQKLTGIRRAVVNLHQKALYVEWFQEQIPLSKILSVIFQLGYSPVDWNPLSRAEYYRKEKKFVQTRLGVAGLLMMQVGMLSIGLYAGDWHSIDSSIRDLLRWTSALLSLLAMIYCGGLFFRSAINCLRNRNLNMDVPIALALSLTWAGSCYSTLLRLDDVYFDTVTMFIFFLLLSRFFEIRSRDPSSVESGRVLPACAEKFDEEGSLATTPASLLKTGDIICCPAGETLAADGIVDQGESRFDEALFTGESDPVDRRVGSAVYAATINVEQPVNVRITAVGKDCAVYQLEKLATEVDAQKPGYARMIDRYSPWFVGMVILVALCTALFWSLNDSGRVFMATVAVLVAACPCALSLATPVAYASANSLLRSKGILPKSVSLIEKLPQVTHFVFDKTGTLTGSEMLVQSVDTFRLPEEEALQFAASLEATVSHPMARAIVKANNQSLFPVSKLNVVNGSGVEGQINGRLYRIGKPAWSRAIIDWPEAEEQGDSGFLKSGDIVLASGEGVLASFQLTEKLRPEAFAVVQQLKRDGYRLSILSGDSTRRVSRVAEKLGIANYRAEMNPEQKLYAIQSLQSQGNSVVMIGDGLNDVPVMAAADASVAVSNASALNQSHADAVLINDDLAGLLCLVAVARQGKYAVRQNISWAIAYNVMAIPLAATALLAPWLAALGMSLSSLAVVLNARRIVSRVVQSNSKTFPKPVPDKKADRRSTMPVIDTELQFRKG